MSSSPFIISGTPVYGPRPESPPLDPDTFALDFTPRPALSQAGPATVAVFAGGVLPGRYGEIYGGRVAGALQIVAIELRSGRVSHRNAERGHTVPLSAAMEPAPAPPAPDEAELESLETYFAVDLRAHLGLPPTAASYGVFLWLDEMTSPVRVVQLPGPEGAQTPVLPGAGVTDEGFQFRRTEGTPPAAGVEIVLQQRSVAPGAIRIYGTAAPALLATAPQAPGSDYFTVLALDYRSRSLKWWSYLVPEYARLARDLAFDFDLLTLLGGPGWLDATKPPRKAFVLASARGALSRVLTVEV
jgi:hypothetical protein